MKIKRTLSILLSVILLFSMAIPVIAAESNTTSNKVTTFSDFCRDYYFSHELYIVYDKSGNDISDSYYSSTLNWYTTGNTDAIFQYIKENVLYFNKVELINNSYTRGAIQTSRQTATFPGFVDNSKINDFDIVYTLTGEFSYNANTGKVTAFSSPSISLTHVGISNMVSASMTNVSTSANMTSDGYGVVFEGHFDIETTQTFPIDFVSFPIIRETTGPYRASFTAYGD